MHDQVRYCTFRLGESEFAIEVADIQEVLRDCEWTPVPRAPSAVLGLMNLRGQIVTVIDLANWLRIAPRADPQTVPTAPGEFNIVLAGARPPLSLAVDDVGDVVTLAAEDLEAAPATLDARARSTVRGVHLSAERLITVLETKALLEAGKTETASVG